MAWSLSQTLSISSSKPFPCHIYLSPRIRNSLSFSPSKRNNKRNNFLRQKLLKTLTKPIPLQTLQNPNPRKDAIEIPTSPFKQEEEKEEEREQEVKELISQSPAIPNAFGFDSPKSFINIALCLLGLFVFQTVCTVWILGSAEIDEKLGNSTVGVENVDREGNGDMGFSSGESELEKKVLEIQVLAREARAIERKKSRNEASVSSSAVSGDDVIVGTGISRVRTDVRKEVDRRLIKLQKSLRSREKSPQPVSRDAKGGKLAFRKKPVVRNSPKGFGSVKSNKNPTFRRESDESSLLDQGVEATDVLDGNSFKNEESRWLSDEVMERIVLKVWTNEEAGREPLSGLASVEEMNFFQALKKKFEREGGNNVKQWMEKRIEGIDLGSGINISDITDKLIERSRSGCGNSVSGIENSDSFQEDFRNNPSSAEKSLHDKNYASKISKGTDNRNEDFLNENKSRELGTKISRHSKNVNQDTFSEHGKKILSSSNGSSNSQLQTRKVNQTMPSIVKDSESDMENNLWWLHLPYVLAILLHRGSDHKGPGGFYSLKMNSHSGNGSCSSYTIAFEDRGDATNFCYLLESFFEDLGDFSAEVVPLSIKELEEGVKSEGVKIIVVRKGQLKLYAGQPLEDVEMSLRSIL